MATEAKLLLLARPSGQASRWTTGWVDGQFALAVAVLTVAHVGLAAWLAPQGLELVPSSSPLTQFLTRLARGALGDTIFASRAVAVPLSLAVLAVLGNLSQGRSLLFLGLFTPVVLFGTVPLSPELLLAFFWTLYLRWIVGTHRLFSNWSGDPVQRVYQSRPVSWIRWMTGGVLAGLGMAAEPTMGLVLPCAFLLFATAYRLRAWLGGFVLHGAVALGIAAWSHGPMPWGPGTWGQAAGLSAGGASSLWELARTQSVQWSALPWLITPWIIAEGRVLGRDPDLRVCGYFFLPPFAFFAAKALGHQQMGNQGLVAFLAFWPLADRLLQWNSFKTFGRILVVISFAAAWAQAALLVVSTVVPWGSGT